VASSFSLANGVRVVVVENHRLPIVAFELVAGAAGSREDGDRHGLAAVTADLLDKGDPVADRLDELGATLDVHIAPDYASIAMTALAGKLDAAAALLATVVRAPRFDELEVERAREMRIAELVRDRDQATTACAQLFDRVVFGEHPYAHTSEGESVAVARLVPADVRGFWKRAYGPTTTTIVVAGDITRATLEPALTAAFGDWTNATPEPPRTPLVAGPSARQLAYVDRPGAATATIMVGRRGFAGGDPRNLGADVVDAVLGGSQSSRLVLRLRDELGYTHGVGAGFWRGQWGGTWSVATTVKASVAGATVTEITTAIERARTADVSADELAAAKAAIARALAQSFETAAGTARAYARLVVTNQPLDVYTTYRGRLDHVTAASARAAIESMWTEPTVVVVGDWSVVGPQLSSTGLAAKRYEP
jgi:zinc protease